MTSELVRVVRCDVCGAEKATEHALTLDGQRLEVDLCPDDSGPLEGLLSLLETHGRRARSSPRASSANPSTGRSLLDPDAPETEWQRLGRTCPRCEYSGPTRSATATHCRVVHQEALAKVEREVGRRFTCGACPLEHATYLGMTQHQRAHPPAA